MQTKPNLPPVDKNTCAIDQTVNPKVCPYQGWKEAPLNIQALCHASSGPNSGNAQGKWFPQCHSSESFKIKLIKLLLSLFSCFCSSGNTATSEVQSKWWVWHHPVPPEDPLVAVSTVGHQFSKAPALAPQSPRPTASAAAGWARGNPPGRRPPCATPRVRGRWSVSRHRWWRVRGNRPSKPQKKKKHVLKLCFFCLGVGFCVSNLGVLMWWIVGEM